MLLDPLPLPCIEAELVFYEALGPLGTGYAGFFTFRGAPFYCCPVVDFWSS